MCTDRYTSDRLSTNQRQKSSEGPKDSIEEEHVAKSFIEVGTTPSSKQSDKQGL